MERIFPRIVKSVVWTVEREKKQKFKILHTYLLTYLLHGAESFLRSILWNPKVHYRTHKRPPPVPILGQPNPVHVPTSNLLEIRPNIIHPSTPRSPQWSLSLWFPHQDIIRPPLLTHTRHMPSPSHSIPKKKCNYLNLKRSGWLFSP